MVVGAVGEVHQAGGEVKVEVSLSRVAYEGRKVADTVGVGA